MNTALHGIIYTAARYNDTAAWYKERGTLSAARYNISARWYSDSPLHGILTPLLGMRDEEISPLLGMITPLHGTGVCGAVTLSGTSSPMLRGS